MSELDGAPINQEGQTASFPVSVTEADIEVRLHELETNGKIEGDSIPFHRKRYFNILNRYKEIEPKLNIDDSKIARLCQVLTDNGIITRESCEGHPEKGELPFVYFITKKQSALKLLSKVVVAESPLKHFEWQISVYNVDLAKPVGYWLEPKPGEVADITQDHSKLVQDLDYLGMSVMSAFEEA